ncbi:MAG: glycosyltransferase, partial [Prevotella sp.]|nr:glycosyltransferase [Prevotella sp.]
MEKLDIAFVILHYLGIDDTIECVDSIEKYVDTERYRIVIVDNCSPDNSYVSLEERYGDNPHIYVIHNTINLGFAKGNNTGIEYLNSKYATDFIVVANNDTCLFQGHIYNNLCNAYKMNRFAVLGPMIITSDGTCKSNPYTNGE